MKTSRFRSLLLLLLTLLLMCSSVCSVFGADAVGFADGTVPYPSVSAKSGILMDAATGEVLWEKDMNAQMYPASLTKILTCILAIERLNPADTIVIDEEVVNTYTSWSDVKLSVGDKITVENALYCLMMESNNAIAVAIGKTISGTMSAFADLMNTRAAELGATHSHFVTANGLHDDQHYTTAYDLAILTKYALTLPDFRTYAGCLTHDFPATRISAARTMKNTHWLMTGNTSANALYVNNQKRYAQYEGMICGKTGTTDQAGGCLVSAAKEGDTTLIAIVLQAGTKSTGYVGRYVDSIALLDWGFDNYKTVRISEKNTALGNAAVKRGSVLTVPAVAASSQFSTVDIRADVSQLRTELALYENLTAPVRFGDTVGTYTVYLDGKKLGTYSAIAASDVPEGGFLSRFGIPDAKAFKIYRSIAYGCAALATVFVILLAVSLMNGQRTGQRPLFRRRRFH